MDNNNFILIFYQYNTIVKSIKRTIRIIIFRKLTFDKFIDTYGFHTMN